MGPISVVAAPAILVCNREGASGYVAGQCECKNEV